MSLISTSEPADRFSRNLVRIFRHWRSAQPRTF